MDILRPPTVWLGGRCYRVISPVTSRSNVNYAEADTYPFEESVYQDEVDCAAEMPEVPIDQLDNGKFQSSIPVANTYFSYIIGSKGATKKRIENDTYTQIRIPAKGQSGDIVVTGRDIKTVRQARIKIELLVEQARKKAAFTHFLSMPLNNSAIQERFLEFKKEVLEKCGDSCGVDETIFQNPAKLHLTLCVMVLADERERHQAVDILKICPDGVFRKYLAGERLKVEMKGIEYMNDDPGEVDVLYGQVTALNWAHSLQTIADSLVDEFVKAGVVNRQYERVKLHVTLMNTLFRQDRDGVTDSKTSKDRESISVNTLFRQDRDGVTNSKTSKDRESFSARRILEEFKDYSFGEMEVEEVHLSVRYSTASNGFYTASGKIPVWTDSS